MNVNVNVILRKEFWLAGEFLSQIVIETFDFNKLCINTHWGVIVNFKYVIAVVNKNWTIPEDLNKKTD